MIGYKSDDKIRNNVRTIKFKVSLLLLLFKEVRIEVVDDFVGSITYEILEKWANDKHITLSTERIKRQDMIKGHSVYFLDSESQYLALIFSK